MASKSSTCACGDCIVCDADGRTEGPLSLPGESVRTAVSSLRLTCAAECFREELSWTDDESHRDTVLDVKPPDGCEDVDAWDWCLRMPELASVAG